MRIELDWLKKWNQYAPNSVAIKDGETGREFTYKSFYELSQRGASVLEKKFQIQKGDRVAVLATNELEYVFLFFSLQRLGAIMVPVNFRLTQREVDHIITDCAPKVIVHQEDYTEIVKNIPPNQSNTQSYLLSEFSKDLGCQEAIKTSYIEGVQLKDFVPDSANDSAMIIYTSGTTGAPKGAIISYDMLFWNSVNTTLRLNISQNDCTVIFLPFFHTGGWNVLTTPFIHRGAKTIFLKKFDAEQILKLSSEEKATILFGVPTTMDMMARTSTFKKIDISSIRYAIVGGEPMPVDLIKTWHDKGIPIRQGYGLTEFGPNVFSLNQEDAIRKIGSIGFTNFYTEAKIVDNDDKELGNNEIGELALQGPMCMTGYWKNDKATKDTIKDGWLYTGDLVKRDDEGYYYVVGRKKDMYKSGGENVYPPELEQVIRHLKGVREVAVIGVPDSKWGEVGKAFVVKDDASLTEEALTDYCLKNLAKFKIPKYFQFVD
ncbi:MAG: AMP-binding protein, partial [Bdellovibrionales bacterium]|nr:AMP-binding protein [Bdellovibrionales bacterium]